MPLFSPDGQWLLFHAGAFQVKKVKLDGGVPVLVADTGSGNGATWTSDDEIVFGPAVLSGLTMVQASGGTHRVVTNPDSAAGESHLWPVAIPNERRVVFAINSGLLTTSRLAIASLHDGKITPLGVPGIRPLAVLDRAIVYVTADGGIKAVSLNATGTGVTGAPILVHDPVEVAFLGNGDSPIYVSPGGALVAVVPGSSRSRLAWLGRDGRSRPMSPDLRSFQLMRLSPDGRQLAAIVEEGATWDIWIYNLSNGTSSRLTSVGSVTAMAWSKDGSKIVYGDKAGNVWSQSVTQGTSPTALGGSGNGPVNGVDLSPDSRTLLIHDFANQVLHVDLDSRSAIRPLFRTYTGGEPRLSPDGRWLAYAATEGPSLESGYTQVYIRSFPDPTIRTQISNGQGWNPVWSRDGARLYYQAGEAILAARVTFSPSPVVISRDTVSTSAAGVFDVAPDGRIIAPIKPTRGLRLEVVPTWLTEFRQKMAASRK
jgi:WD40 repeat protein